METYRDICIDSSVLYETGEALDNAIKIQQNF